MAMTLITTNTSSGAASSSFTSSIDSTYKLYIFKWYDVNPATNAAHFTFQGSIDGGSNYNVTMTATTFQAYNKEDASAASLDYTGEGQAQGTAFQNLTLSIGSGGDESGAGELYLFNPSNTTYVKHFFSRAVKYDAADYAGDNFIGGYFNNADNIDAIQFKMSSGNMDAVIRMYGVG